MIAQSNIKGSYIGYFSIARSLIFSYEMNCDSNAMSTKSLGRCPEFVIECSFMAAMGMLAHYLRKLFLCKS